jgi:hypothetical protein
MMKRIVVMVLALVLTAGVAWAGTEAYKLVMSEEKDICQLMLKFADERLLQTENLENLPNLEAPGFSFVRWESITRAPSFQDHNGNVEGSLFDINNDGQLDWVVRIQWALGGLYNHELAIYEKRQEPLFQDVGFDSRDIDRADAHLNFVGRDYFLTKIPQYKSKKGQEFYYSVASVPFLIPFQFKNVTYILMANPFASPELLPGGRNFAVVAKYLRTFQLLDVCYIEEVRKKPKTR